MASPLNIDQSPMVLLGGRDWPVPELAVRQIMRLVPLMGRLYKAGAASAGILDEEEIGWLYEIAYVALTRAHPDLSRQAFDEMPIRLHEIMSSLPVIARQAGLEFKEGGAAGED